MVDFYTFARIFLNFKKLKFSYYVGSYDNDICSISYLVVKFLVNRPIKAWDVTPTMAKK